MCKSQEVSTAISLEKDVAYYVFVWDSLWKNMWTHTTHGTHIYTAYITHYTYTPWIHTTYKHHILHTQIHLHITCAPSYAQYHMLYHTMHILHITQTYHTHINNFTNTTHTKAHHIYTTDTHYTTHRNHMQTPHTTDTCHTGNATHTYTLRSHHTPQTHIPYSHHACFLSLSVLLPFSSSLIVFGLTMKAGSSPVSSPRTLMGFGGTRWNPSGACLTLSSL